MTVIELCPSCLGQLPADYPFDHVAIDRALSGDLDVFRYMRRDERREVITTGRSRGLTDTAIATLLHRSNQELRHIMGEEERLRIPRKGGRRDGRIRELWDRGLSDRQIARTLDIHRNTVQRRRNRLGLAPNPPAEYAQVVAA